MGLRFLKVAALLVCAAFVLQIIPTEAFAAGKSFRRKQGGKVHRFHTERAVRIR